MKGENVEVKRRVPNGVDEMNSPVYTSEVQAVEDVLIAPGPREDIDGAQRPEGVIVAYTLYFPKTFVGSLRGCEVTVYGEDFQVVGDPRPYPVHLCPTRWNRVVEVRSARG